jgi:hypothetical protein
MESGQVILPTPEAAVALRVVATSHPHTVKSRLPDIVEGACHAGFAD